MQKFQAIGIPFWVRSLTVYVGAFQEVQRKRRKGHLQRLFSAFPGGWPGVGLLLLRAAIGLVTLVQGVFYLTDKPGTLTGVWIGAVIELASGSALLIGLLTPIAGVIAGLGTLGIGFSFLPAPVPNLFEAKLTLALTGIMIIAVIFLGPGRYSLDARLFGHREIIIPPSPRRRED